MDYKEKLNKAKEEMTRIRRENLTELVQRYGSLKALAIAVSRPATQIGDMVRGQKPIGDRITRHIEDALGLDENSLDKRSNVVVDENVGRDELLPRDAFDNNVNEETSVNFFKVPIYASVRAGEPTDSGNIDFDDYIYCTSNVPGAYALKVKGDSMRPWFSEGDIVIVDPNRSPRPMDYVIAQSELDSIGETTLKQYLEVGFDDDGRAIFQLRPLNSAYAVMNSKAQKLRVIGVVIELIKKF